MWPAPRCVFPSLAAIMEMVRTPFIDFSEVSSSAAAQVGSRRHGGGGRGLAAFAVWRGQGTDPRVASCSWWLRPGLTAPRPGASPDPATPVGPDLAPRWLQWAARWSRVFCIDCSSPGLKIEFPRRPPSSPPQPLPRFSFFETVQYIICAAASQALCSQRFPRKSMRVLGSIIGELAYENVTAWCQDPLGISEDSHFKILS